MRQLNIGLLTCFGLLSCWFGAGAEADELRRSAWTFGLRSISYDYESATESKLWGMGGSVEFGYGHFSDSWFGYVSISSLSGPFDRIRKDRVSMDFNGTGMTAVAGFAPFQNSMRSGSFRLSVLTGIFLSDMVGRSVGRIDINDEQKIASNEDSSVSRRIRSYTMQVNEFNLLTGIGCTWFASARTRGNSPEQLRTTFDGMLGMFGVSVPVATSYKSKIEQSIDAGPYETRKVKGRLSGVSLIVSLTTLIGV